MVSSSMLLPFVLCLAALGSQTSDAAGCQEVFEGLDLTRPSTAWPSLQSLDENIGPFVNSTEIPEDSNKTSLPLLYENDSIEMFVAYENWTEHDLLVYVYKDRSITFTLPINLPPAIPDWHIGVPFPTLGIVELHVVIGKGIVEQDGSVERCQIYHGGPYRGEVRPREGTGLPGDGSFHFPFLFPVCDICGVANATVNKSVSVFYPWYGINQTCQEWMTYGLYGLLFSDSCDYLKEAAGEVCGCQDPSADLSSGAAHRLVGNMASWYPISLIVGVIFVLGMS